MAPAQSESRPREPSALPPTPASAPRAQALSGPACQLRPTRSALVAAAPGDCQPLMRRLQAAPVRARCAHRAPRCAAPARARQNPAAPVPHCQSSGSTAAHGPAGTAATPSPAARARHGHAGSAERQHWRLARIASAWARGAATASRGDLSNPNKPRHRSRHGAASSWQAGAPPCATIDLAGPVAVARPWPVGVARIPHPVRFHVHACKPWVSILAVAHQPAPPADAINRACCAKRPGRAAEPAA